MRVRVVHGIDDLNRDMEEIPRKADRDFRRTIREAGRVGNSVARDNARRTAGKHGKHYPKAFSVDYAALHMVGVSVYQAEYGPDASKPQGGMSFEGGSRNQPAHNDLAKSADLLGPALAGEVRRLPDGWFW